MGDPSAAFPETPRFEAFCRRLNSFSTDLFAVALTRVLESCCSSRRAFNDTEFAELAALTGLSPQETCELVEGCAFVFERAASTGLKPTQLLTALAAHGVNEQQATLISRTWAAGSAELLAAQRGALLGAPGVLASSAYSLILGAGSSAEAGTKAARAVLTMQVKSGDGSCAAPEPPLRLELDRAQLTTLLAQLDRVQQQVDSLSQ
jgi:hypothetical protein